MDEGEGDLLNIRPPLTATSTQVVEVPEPPKAVDVIDHITTDIMPKFLKAKNWPETLRKEFLDICINQWQI